MDAVSFEALNPRKVSIPPRGQEVYLRVWADPRELAETYLDSWRRFSRGEDEVSRLVREVDKLERGLQAVRYLKKGYSEVKEIYDSTLNELKDPELRRVLERALKEI